MLIYLGEIRIYFKGFPTRVCKAFGNVSAHLFTSRYFLGKGQECLDAFNDRHINLRVNSSGVRNCDTKKLFFHSSNISKTNVSIFYFIKKKKKSHKLKTKYNCHETKSSVILISFKSFHLFSIVICIKSK